MRGISSLVATILMVVIATTAAVVAYSWFTSVLGSLQARASQRVSSVSSVVFTVPSAWCDSNSNEVKVFIVNLSDENINTTAWVALLSADGYGIDVNSNVPVSVPAHDTSTVPVKFTQNCSNAKYVKVTIGSVSAVAPLTLTTS